MNPASTTIVPTGIESDERPAIDTKAASEDRKSRPASAVEPRAIVFIDGSNWYHGLRKIGVRSSVLDYRAVASKLAMGRRVLDVRYYAGKVIRGTRSETGQARFVISLRERGVEVVLGKVQRNPLNSKEQAGRQQLLRLLQDRENEVPGDLLQAIRNHFVARSSTDVEKQVDTAITADLVDLAHRDEYDVAYLLSADSDFIPAVRIVQRLGKTVFGVSARPSHELGRVVTKHIPLRSDWFEGLYL